MPAEESEDVIYAMTRVMFLGIGPADTPKLVVREDDAPPTPQAPR
ncbi:hypothetical protein ABT213_06140 [Streptomyces sp. NPDC001674]